MERSEVIDIIEKLRRIYPKFIQTTALDPDAKTLLKNTVDLWHELFGQLPTDVCKFAVTRHIAESRFPPTPHDIITLVREATEFEKGGAIEAWNALAKAAKRATVITPAEYAALPEEVKKFCGGLSGLVDMGNLDEDIFNTVTRGQFMKIYDVVRRRRETLEMLPPGMALLAQNSVKELAGMGEMT